eukprot:gene6576-13305_t
MPSGFDHGSNGKEVGTRYWSRRIQSPTYEDMSKLDSGPRYPHKNKSLEHLAILN